MLSLGRVVSAVACAVISLTFVTTLAGGCRDRRVAILNVEVTTQDELPAIVRVAVSASTEGHAVDNQVTGSSGQPVTWPVRVALNVSAFPNGDAIIEARAFDDSQNMVARGTSTVTLPASGPILVDLHCQSLACSAPGADAGNDAGVDAQEVTDAATDGPGTINPTCGNGRIDPGEICDTALGPELPGACPAQCDDGIPCTIDQRTGDACNVMCTHSEIDSIRTGDGCCPAQADYGTDSDCSMTCGNQRVDPGEGCDTGIATGPGACPAAGSCDDGDPCTTDQLISAATCSARCAHTPILTATDGDTCCPVAANATTDNDCQPVCGNGIAESTERCDPGLSSGKFSCPTAADCDDGNPCTTDSIAGVACQASCSHRVIEVPVPGDGCCPLAGLARNIDADCPAVCGNGVPEAGETCDMALLPTATGGCPASCPTSTSSCVRYLMQGSAGACSAACIATPTSACLPTTDGCCPTGCVTATDPDCSATCGNGKVDTGESCDTAIATGAGACPKTCSDGVPCTDDLLVDAQTCNARCVFVTTTATRNGDGCCPAKAHAGIDTDCPATCGNAVVEPPSETCDTGTLPGSCPATCPPAEACATWTRTSASGCDVRCTRQAITTCANTDGCCAPGCTAANDSDCAPRCGNAVVEPTETCDRGITAGHTGACPASCGDNDSCTLDFARGSSESCSRVCSHVQVTACGGGDRCCPTGCGPDTDADCATTCGDGQVQAQETCDPASTCPTSCASDGDPCTVDQLVGSATACSAACAHVPILRCSGTQRDSCCPTECGAASDSDC